VVVVVDFTKSRLVQAVLLIKFVKKEQSKSNQYISIITDIHIK